jgi:hypothetical protein
MERSLIEESKPFVREHYYLLLMVFKSSWLEVQRAVMVDQFFEMVLRRAFRDNLKTRRYMRNLYLHDIMEEQLTMEEQLRLRDQERQKKIDSGEIVCDIKDPDNCESCSG